MVCAKTYIWLSRGQAGPEIAEEGSSCPVFQQMQQHHMPHRGVRIMAAPAGAKTIRRDSASAGKKNKLCCVGLIPFFMIRINLYPSGCSGIRN